VRRERPERPAEGILKLYDLRKTRTIILKYLKDNHHRLRQHTQEGYIVVFNQFFKYCNIDYNQVTTQTIRAWLTSLDEKGIKKLTLRLKIITLRTFYQYCIEEGLMTENPVTNIRLPKHIDHPYAVRYIEKSTYLQLMELTNRMPFEQAILATLYATGVRLNELLNIRLADINWDERKIVIRQGKGSKDRTVLFTAECAERLKAYLITLESPYLFSLRGNEAPTQQWVRLKFKGYTEALDVERPITPHNL